MKLRRRRRWCCLEVFLAGLLLPWSSTPVLPVLHTGTPGAAPRAAMERRRRCSGRRRLLELRCCARRRLRCPEVAGRICHGEVLRCFGGMVSEEEDVGWGFCDQTVTSGRSDGRPAHVIRGNRNRV